MPVVLRDDPLIFKLEVDATAKSDLTEMARWTKFLAVLAFVMMSLALVGSVIGGVILARFSDAANAQGANDASVTAPFFIAVVAVVVIAVNLYPAYALFKFSTCIRHAVGTEDKEQFNRGIRYLKNMFKYFGIMMIVMVIIYALQILLTMMNTGR
jgi:membrane-anchored glycerophosphoryl diester phosphodiesterase (GDPDase)